MTKNIPSVVIFTIICLASSFSSANEDDPFIVFPAMENPELRLSCFDDYTKLRANSSTSQVSPSESSVIDTDNPIAEETTKKYSGTDIAGPSSHEQNRLLIRGDKTGLDEVYMDADLSIKYPFLTGLVEYTFNKSKLRT